MFLFLGLLTKVVRAQSGYDYNGGVSLRYSDTTCPSGSMYIGTSLAANCCPEGQFGAPSGSGYCCPTDSDCHDQVYQYLKCADPSWTYCRSPEDTGTGFCCLQGWTCYQEPLLSPPGNNGVNCAPPGVALEEDQTAVPTVYQAYQGPGAYTSTTSSTTSSETPETSSTTSETPTTTSETPVPESTETSDTTSPTSSTESSTEDSTEPSSTTESTTVSSPTEEPAPASTTGPSAPTGTAQPSGLNNSDRIALGVGIGIGLPGTLGTIITGFYVCARRRN